MDFAGVRYQWPTTSSRPSGRHFRRTPLGGVGPTGYRTRIQPVGNAAEAGREQQALDDSFDWRHNQEPLREKEFSLSGPNEQSLLEILEEDQRERGEQDRIVRSAREDKELEAALEKEREQTVRRESEELAADRTRSAKQQDQRDRGAKEQAKETARRIQASATAATAATTPPLPAVRTVFSPKLKKIL